MHEASLTQEYPMKLVRSSRCVKMCQLCNFNKMLSGRAERSDRQKVKLYSNGQDSFGKYMQFTFCF